MTVMQRLEHFRGILKQMLRICTHEMSQISENKSPKQYFEFYQMVISRQPRWTAEAQRAMDTKIRGADLTSPDRKWLWQTNISWFESFLRSLLNHISLDNVDLPVEQTLSCWWSGKHYVYWFTSILATLEFLNATTFSSLVATRDHMGMG